MCFLSVVFIQQSHVVKTWKLLLTYYFYTPNLQETKEPNSINRKSLGVILKQLYTLVAFSLFTHENQNGRLRNISRFPLWRVFSHSCI